MRIADLALATAAALAYTLAATTIAYLSTLDGAEPGVIDALVHGDLLPMLGSSDFLARSPQLLPQLDWFDVLPGPAIATAIVAFALLLFVRHRKGNARTAAWLQTGIAAAIYGGAHLSLCANTVPEHAGVRLTWMFGPMLFASPLVLLWLVAANWRKRAATAAPTAAVAH